MDLKAIAVYTGDEAVKIANNYRPDILVIDVVMAGINGIDAAILIRKLLPSCKIVLLSGQNIAAELLEKAREQGHKFEIIAKPLHPNQLTAHLRGDIASNDSA